MVEFTVHEWLIQALREGFLLALTLAAPMALAALVIGFVVSVFQAVTQIGEPTLGFVPKVCAVVIALSISAPWLGQHMLDLTLALFESIPRLARQ